MSKKKRYIIISIISISIVILLAVILINVIDYDPENIVLDGRKFINCKTEQCPTIYSDSYDRIKLKYDIKELQEKIDKINKETDEFYEKVRKSTISGDECKSFNGNEQLNVKYRVNNEFSIYSNEKYISISVWRRENEICNNKFINHNVENYIYDKEKERLITQDEFKKDNGIDKLSIRKAVSRGIGKNSVMGTVEDSEKNEVAAGENMINVAYFSSDGELYLSYFVKTDNAFYIVSLEDDDD